MKINTMPIKKSKKPAKLEKPLEKISQEKGPTGKYFYSIGKRKTAVAQVRIYPVNKAIDDGSCNGKKISDYFTIMRLRDLIKSPLVNTGNEEKFDMNIKVSGGGINSQAEAIRLGISRALVKYEPSLRKQLKDLGFLTRDSRIVERKKPGLKKARRAPQWAKR